MDKFGVFNLINSLLNVYKNQKKDFSPLINAENKESSLKTPAVKSDTERVKNTLGDKILETAASHDEFIKRVKKAQQNKNE